MSQQGLGEGPAGPGCWTPFGKAPVVGLSSPIWTFFSLKKGLIRLFRERQAKRRWEGGGGGWGSVCNTLRLPALSGVPRVEVTPGAPILQLIQAEAPRASGTLPGAQP